MECGDSYLIGLCARQTNFHGINESKLVGCQLLTAIQITSSANSTTDEDNSEQTPWKVNLNQLILRPLILHQLILNKLISCQLIFYELILRQIILYQLILNKLFLCQLILYQLILTFYLRIIDQLLKDNYCYIIFRILQLNYGQQL